MALLIGAEFGAREDAEGAHEAVVGLGIELARALIVDPLSPSRGHAPPANEGPLLLRARKFDQRIARGAAGGAILIGTGLAVLLSPVGLVFLGATAGAAVGAVIGSVLAATSSIPAEDDAMRLMMDVSSEGTWVVLIEVQQASEARTVREVLDAWGGQQLDPWREQPSEPERSLLQE